MASKFFDIPEDASKYGDFINEPDEILPPIQGVEDQPLVSLEDALKPLESLVPELDHMVYTVKRRCKNPKDGLSFDESAAIMLYTLEWGPPAKPFYSILNEKLRCHKRRVLLPWFLYLRLITNALAKLPTCKHKIIYRGVKLDLASKYSQLEELIWWGFSSCTSDLATLEHFIGKSGERTIFNITYHSAKDIHDHSFFPEELEVLFFPAREFKIKAKLNAGNGLHIIHIEESEPRYPHFRIPSLITNPSVKVDQSINILLIGEKNVGKSTFINAFANYLKFKTIEQAKSNEPLVLKPLSFIMLTSDTFTERTIKYGDVDNYREPIDRRCQTYKFDLNDSNERNLCLIDTPSLHDIKDYGQDYSNTIKHILEYVNNLTHLNAICFLVQPDASKLQNSFQSCFSQLLNRLGPNARRNIIFCFTNAFTTFSTPGTTAGLLRNMFNTLSMNDINFTRNNSFFFENESFRYLMAANNGIRFSADDISEYATTWSECVQESKRLLNYVRNTLNPYQITKKK